MKWKCNNCQQVLDLPSTSLNLHCPKCGKKIDFEHTEPSRNVLQPERNICPICCTVVEDSDEAIACPDCKIKYHKDCWIANNGCATYGCPSSGCLAPPPPKISLEECNKELHDNVEVATEQSTESIICPYCHTKLPSNTNFCWNCGKDLPENCKRTEASNHVNNSYSIKTPATVKCSFGKKVLAVAACAGYFLVITLIYYAIYGDSMNKANSSSSKPYCLYFLIISGCSGIWKSITGKK